ncbi:MAG: CoA transferase, partial [Pseudomonadota bacterium]
MTPNQITTELARDLGWPDAPIDRLSVDPTPTALATWMPIADMAAAAQGLVGLAAAAMHEARGGPVQDVSVDRWSASLSMTASAYLTVDGEKPVSWDPLTGYFCASDGWVYLHCQFPHLRNRLLEAFALPNDHDAVIAAFAKLPAQQIENRAAQAGVCAIMRRDRTTWDRHPQAAELKRCPVVSLERIADLPTDPSNGARARGRRPLNGWTGSSPLEGVRVLDLSRVIAGPMMGRTLAEHGAEVLRIGASHLPVFEGLVINTGFGKRSVHVDLRTDAGRDTLASLIREADILIDGFRPGALTALGLGQEALQDLNPNLIYMTLSAFGETGPWGGRR